MQISNPYYIQRIKEMKQAYSKLPWYQRFWFGFWSYSLSCALSEIDFNNPTTEQVNSLLNASEETWFFKTIFGLLKNI